MKTITQAFLKQINFKQIVKIRFQRSNCLFSSVSAFDQKQQRDVIFSHLWNQYLKQNPEIQQIYKEFTEIGEKVINDHIAIRTFNDPKINIQQIARPFIEAGYVEKGNYIFQQKKLVAKHYEAPNPDEPKVFISELILNDVSKTVRDIINKTINSVDENVYKDKSLIYKGNVWGTPSFKTYEILRKESEYAAWTYVNGFFANHFTLNINLLQKLTTIEQVNDFLKSKGHILNTSGGEIKGKVSDLLQQSSTMAGKVKIDFLEGSYEIPSCYYEFAVRYPDNSGKLFNGFIAENADKIFESTNQYDQKKN